MDPSLRATVQSLRAEGLTFAEISNRLGTTLSKSTLSTWCRAITLSDKQVERIEAIKKDKLALSRTKALIVNKIAREKYLTEISARYSYLRPQLEGSLDSSLMVLATLYLTEGSKQSGKLTFGNSDLRIIKLFLKLLRICFKIDESKFRCTVQRRADQNDENLLRYWSQVTGIPSKQFYESRVDPRSVGKHTLKGEYMGVCRIDYFSGYIYNELRVIASLIT